VLAGTAFLLVLTACWPAWPGETRTNDPFAFFRPWVNVTEDDRSRLDRGEVLARVLPASRGEIAVFAASAVRATADEFIHRIRDIADLKKSRFVHAIRRFSDPPALDDLADLALDERDLEAIRRCRPGDCGLKLSTPDIEALHGVLEQAGPDWTGAVQDGFRRAVFRRVELYRAGGLSALPAYGNRANQVPPHEVYAGILQNSPYLLQGAPALSSYLSEFPRGEPADIDSFLYWSKEQLNGKPVISVTHVCIWKGEAVAGTPRVLVAGKQVMATHYLDGGLGLTVLLGGADEAATYLVYVNRSQTDVLGGFWGGLKRAIIEKRLERETGRVVLGLRTRLETVTRE
jgi:hypothetical protein